MGISNTQDYFTKRRKQLRVERYLQRLHQQPLMTQARRARFEAVEHAGNALGHGLGLEFYDCEAARRGLPEANHPKDLPIALVLEAHG